MIKYQIRREEWEGNELVHYQTLNKLFDNLNEARKNLPHDGKKYVIKEIDL